MYFNVENKIQNKKGLTFETRCQGCEFQLVICLIFEVDISAGFGLGLACFLAGLVIFEEDLEALSITRSAIDGRSNIVLEKEAADTSVINKIIIFISIFKLVCGFLRQIRSFCIYNPCVLLHAFIGA